MKTATYKLDYFGIFLFSEGNRPVVCDDIFDFFPDLEKREGKYELEISLEPFDGARFVFYKNDVCIPTVRFTRKGETHHELVFCSLAKILNQIVTKKKETKVYFKLEKSN